MMPAASTEESAALDRLRSRLLSSGEFSNAPGRQMLAAFGGVDLCLLRFLRARRYDVNGTHVALTATLAFRTENGVGTPQTATAVHSDGVGDWWCGTFAGRTENGCPVTYWRFRCIEADELKRRFDEAQLKRFYIAWMERGLALQREVVAQRPGGCPGNVDIYDLEGVGWRQLSSGARLLSGVLSVAQANYPENLKHAVVVNAPTAFTGAWRIISAVVDKGTQDKFIIHKDGAEPVLEALLGVGTTRATVWRHADVQLGGGEDDLVSLSASSDWRHEQAITVGVATASTANASTSGVIEEQRLVWRFDLEENESLSFSVHFTPLLVGNGGNSVAGMDPGTDSAEVVVRPRETYNGRGRGAIAQPLPGQYKFVWQAQRRSRTLQLRLRCWLQRGEDHPLGALNAVGGTLSSAGTNARGGDVGQRDGDSIGKASVPYTLLRRPGDSAVAKRPWPFRLVVLLGVLATISLGVHYADAQGITLSRLTGPWLHMWLGKLGSIAMRMKIGLRRRLVAVRFS